MRMFGWIGLLVALLVAGLVAKKQLGAPAATEPLSAPAQGKRIQQEVLRQLDQAMRRPRVPQDQ
ncbi:MAG: hypothetical protein ACRYGA_04370 [Janthinobacterium lividum]